MFFISITALILSTLHDKEYQLAAASLELEEKAVLEAAVMIPGVLEAKYSESEEITILLSYLIDVM